MSSDSSVLNIIEKALLEGLTSKELSQSPSSLYSVSTSPNSGIQINPGNFIPALQSFNPYDETSTTSNVVPYYQSSGSSGFDTSRTLYMFSIKQFSATESTNLTNLINAQSIINTNINSNSSNYGQSMIFDSNANIYSVDAYYEAWCNPSSQSSSLAVTNTNCQSCVSGGISNMDNIVNTIKSNTNYFSFFNPLLKKQPTHTYCIDGNPTKTYSRITMTAPSDRFSETVANIESLYLLSGQTNNYKYLPSNLEADGIYPVYIPSMFFQYFLYKESFSSPWHIIYNPIHRKHYCEYWMNANSNEGSDSSRMSSENTRAHMVNYGNIFKTYRGIKNSTFQSYFVDPICLCVTPLNIHYSDDPILSTSYPTYVGPFVNGSTTIDGTTFSSNTLNSSKDVYSTYTYLNNKQNIYTFPLSQGFGLPESFYQSNTSTTNVPYCWAGCSNNFISPIASWEASDNQQNSYKYSLPVVTLKYSYDCVTFNPITLPLWGLLSFNNYINGRAYTVDGTNKPTYICTDLTVENTVCSTIFNSSGGINVQNSNLTNMCGGGGQSQSNQTLPTPPTNQPTTNVDIPASNQPNQPNQLSVQTSNQTNQQSVKIISNKPSSSSSPSSPSSSPSNIKTPSSNKNILIIIIIISLIIILAGSFFVYYKFKK